MCVCDSTSCVGRVNERTTGIETGRKEREKETENDGVYSHECMCEREREWERILTLVHEWALFLLSLATFDAIEWNTCEVITMERDEQQQLKWGERKEMEEAA